ncbi:uncharacterized protein LOC124935683 [Impatiens glandulifera]|uniref:uncharacterized protein LOC124935683 n=1 Tax=Impatiens glandulifera TaxID=253017 RepID=UPI001FB0D1EB|nr:uncharacterized protein LOC124935683 [Impatiens glandulifera]
MARKGDGIHELETGKYDGNSISSLIVELAKFARIWIGNEIMKATKFEMGLSSHIRQVVVPFNLNSFIDIMEKSRLIERELRITKRIDDESSKKQSNPNIGEGSRSAFQRIRPRSLDNTSQGSRNISLQNQHVQCSHCFKNNRTEECRWITGAYITCGQYDHTRANCPRLRRPFTQPYICESGSSVNQRSVPNQNKRIGQAPRGKVPRSQAQGGQARIFSTINTEQAHNSDAVVSSTIYVSSNYSIVLFDSGATNSFVSQNFVTKHDWSTESRDVKLSVETPLGDKIIAYLICMSMEVQI